MRALAKSKGETLPWLECLPKGIGESVRLVAHLKRWKECCNNAGEFMAEREPKDEDEPQRTTRSDITRMPLPRRRSGDRHCGAGTLRLVAPVFETRSMAK